METRKILITGGSGFIGCNLAQRLCGSHDVTVVDKIEYPDMGTKKDVHYVKKDLSVLRSLDDLAGKFDIVYHFGSLSSIRQFDGKVAQSSSETLISLLNVMEFSKSSQVERVIYPSSGTVYGNSSISSNRKIEPVNIYGVMKYSSEVIARLYSNYFDVCGLRIFMGYGEGEERKGEIGSPVSLFLSSIVKNESPVIWGDGKQSRDLVHISDIVDVAEKCMSINENELAFDVGTGIRTDFLSIIQYINEIADKKISPKFMAKPSDYLETTVGDPEYMLKVLGHPPLSAKKGIERFYRYLIQKR